MKTIAAFDFDGTITTCDTLPDFLIYMFGRGVYYRKLIEISPWLVAYKGGLISNDRAKEKLLSVFLKGYAEGYLNLIAEQYAEERLPQVLRAETMQLILKHKEAGHHLVIVSASPENWIKPWAIKQGFSDVISTRMESSGGVLSGNFETANCYGEEKVRRLVSVFPVRQDYILHAYGDSRGDRELLKFADFGTRIKK